MENTRTAKETYNLMTQLIFPYDVNMHQTLMGGKLMYLMDVCAVISATKLCHSRVVTISVDSLTFKAPIHLGNMLYIESKVTRSFRTSMEVKLLVFSEDILTQQKTKTNYAYFTIGAVDEHLKPMPVPSIVPETEEEKIEYESAIIRREYRLKNNAL